MENLKNLRSHDRGNTWRAIQSELANRGYIVFDKVIDAQAWVPQHRERLFLACFDSHVLGRREDIPSAFPESLNIPASVLGDILEASPDPKYMLSDNLWNWLQAHREKHQSRGNGFGYGLFGPDRVTRTLSARYHKDGSKILVAQAGWRNPRRLTPREAMRLMGFTDQYATQFGHSDGFPIVVSDTQAYKQLGNAVVPRITESIATKLMQMLGQRRVASSTEDSTIGPDRRPLQYAA